MDLRAAHGVLQRLLPGQADAFTLGYLPPEQDNEVFEITSDPQTGHPVIRGSSPTAVLAGVNWYLKYHANIHFSWTGDQTQLPTPLPSVDHPIRIVSPYRHRYMFNYCTFNYSMSFWDWPRWERELDFLALNGVNLMLAVVGQEKVWQNVMQRLEFSETEIFNFIPGPAYQAWWLMGNLEGFGGPVSQAWIDRQAALQRKILARMRELGMEPVLQGFYGMFPRAGSQRFPDAITHRTRMWEGFNRPDMLDPNQPFFHEVAAIWYEEQRKLYGDALFYGGDPFHEGGFVQGMDVTGAARQIQHAMRDAHSGASWVLQAWLSNPRSELLDGTDPDYTLVIDLCGESAQNWRRRQAFGGRPWIWSVISNYGGRPALYGPMNKVATYPPDVLTHPDRGNIQGIGGIMEAIGQDPPLWDLLLEMAWRTEAPDLDTWIENYARRRYGKRTPEMATAWRGLLKAVYTSNSTQLDASTASIFGLRPGLSFDRRRFGTAACWGTLDRQYELDALVAALALMIEQTEAYRGIATFEQDLVNTTRQALNDLAIETMRRIATAWMDRNKAAFQNESARFLDMLTDSARLLATDRHFLLGPWIEDARALGSTPAEQDLFEKNARMLITTWGSSQGQVRHLRDYANRAMAELFETLYHTRWKLFFEALEAMLDTPMEARALPHDPSGIDWFALEAAWTNRTDGYRTQPHGDSIDEARRIFHKYFAQKTQSAQ
jgi:alpha-N-acetylglucosaminidase